MAHPQKKYYVALTGSKNNAGDFLIKNRAFKLLSHLRSDREIIDLNGWEPMDQKKLSLINHAEALLLLGGPALSKHMVPRIYNLDLECITTPIIPFGIGWHSTSTSLETRNYKLSTRTLQAIDRIKNHNLACSVRDAPTKSVLDHHKLPNVKLTGCPALYDLPVLGRDLTPFSPPEINKVGFSLGVSLKQSHAMREQMKQALLETRNALPGNSKIVVAFHHSLGESYRTAHGFNKYLAQTQKQFTAWLICENFNYIDISGSHEKLIDFYNTTDLHIGYRVHAHIHMTSQGRPTILISEDGRGTGLKATINGPILNGVESVKYNTVTKIASKLGIPYETYTPKKGMIRQLRELLTNEEAFNTERMKTKDRLASLWGTMKNFIEALP